MQLVRDQPAVADRPALQANVLIAPSRCERRNGPQQLVLVQWLLHAANGTQWTLHPRNTTGPTTSRPASRSSRCSRSAAASQLPLDLTCLFGAAVSSQSFCGARTLKGYGRSSPAIRPIDHDAMPLVRDQPAVADRPALEAKSQVAGERRRRLVLRPDPRASTLCTPRSSNRCRRRARPASAM